MRLKHTKPYQNGFAKYVQEECTPGSSLDPRPIRLQLNARSPT